MKVGVRVRVRDPLDSDETLSAPSSVETLSSFHAGRYDETLRSTNGERNRMALSRRILRVRGTVQGVGFRPFVYRAARDLDLKGSVWNDADGVVVDAEGTDEALDALLWKLANACPPAARVEGIETEAASPAGRDSFVIEASDASPASSVRVSTDLALCALCRDELLDPRDRRYRYPFINCTDCGPRYSIARDVPYDRKSTTMSVFPMCEACREEYEDPASRRFHAQPNACPDCGPRIWIHDAKDDRDPVEAVAAALRKGKIVAVKGLGGFHLACDAGNDGAVAKLRERKRRPDKPFAVMFPDLASLEREAVVEPGEREALSSSHSPIVLLRRRDLSRPEPALSPRVAPRLAELGAFLPYTPLHHLLLRAFGGPLVMTSGNLTEEPIAAGNEEALERLRGIADLFLLHDREIHMRSDDSVVRILSGREQVQRRARGYVPETIDLVDVPPAVSVLAVGADLKNTLCVTSGGAAVLSQHIGDLESYEAQQFFHEVRANLERLYQVSPTLVAHDLHPGYHSTRIARSLDLPTLAVQHHHAHVASCLADNGRRDRVIGVAWDGTGYGTDGSIWGGEFLVADLRGFERAGRIRPVPLPGGDAAVREPWRMALSHLIVAGLDAHTHLVDRRDRGAVETLIRNAVATVPTSSAGRLFDAVASVLGVRHVNTYEAQAAIELEALSRVDGLEPYPISIVEKEEGILEIDPGVTLRALVADRERDVPAGEIGGRFHLALASAIARVAERVRERTGLETVALSGGCFQSRLLTTLTSERLSASGFEILVHRRVPPNDGGIALGQAAVAAWSLVDPD